MITNRTLWAKLIRDDQKAITSWHSLVHHSADVAAVLQELLDQPTIASRFSHLAGGRILVAGDRARLGALAFLHDIGKANLGFRARVDPKAPLIGHIDQVAWLFSASGTTARNRLFDVLDLDRLDGWFTDEGWNLLEPVFAHHGRPWRRDRNEAAHWKLIGDVDPIADLVSMREAMDHWFPSAFEPGPPLPDEPAFHHAFAGLLMLADWLGSDGSEDFFPFANGAGPDRMEMARRRASHAVETVGLKSATPEVRSEVASVDFATAFRVDSPRPVQIATALPEASCLVLEAETGSGKTEAALWRFKHLFAQGKVDGLYFALPTRVAATAMFKRIKLFRDRVFGGTPPAVVLAVPGQAAVDDAEGRPLPGFGFEWDDADGGNRARWAAEHPKRFLAATIAVGTVDQALLGAIRVRHAHMRGIALLRHLLVVDEVHASDHYMERLLGTLLHNHLGAGGHALLLSATLGSAARARLLQTPCPGVAEAEAVPYPALTWAEHGQERRHDAVGLNGPAAEKRVRVETAPMLDTPETVARLALEAADSGAKVLVIRNTVGAAIATAQALELLAGPDHPVLFRVGQVVTVHHGRFAASDRRMLDAAVEVDLGRGRTRGGLVVVGTQTLEVSLDLDADLLVTDLCPADVLLQRIGRLHRHDRRGRPEGFMTPRVVVNVPTTRNLVSFAGRAGGRHGLGRVYDDLRIVEATWRQIEACPVWSIPADNRRLVEATTHPVHLVRIEAELREADPATWTRHIHVKEGSVAAARNEAVSAALDWSTPFDKFRLDADEHVTTRLGAADRQVDLPDAVAGPFGLPVTRLRIPHHLLSGVLAEAEPTEVRQEGEAVCFRLGERCFRYDRFGLQGHRTGKRAA